MHNLRGWLCGIFLLSAADAVLAAGESCSPQGDLKSAKWREDCDAAISAENDPKALAQLLYGRAYAAAENYRYEDALRDLGAALDALPDEARFLLERAYIHGELSNYSAAIADIDRVQKQWPDEVRVYSERAYARHYNADFEGAYQDRVRAAELKPDSSPSMWSRAEAALWLGRFDVATADARRAVALGRKAGNEDETEAANKLLADIEAWRSVSPGKTPESHCTDTSLPEPEKYPRLIGDCTRAFLNSGDDAAKADALTTRSTAWLVIKGNQNNATEDLRIAVALEPRNFMRHVNLGYAFLRVRHSWAANREFERALALERHWLALAGRAAARSNLGNVDGARADAKASLDIEPNEAATWVLADLAYEDEDKDMARDLYLSIYRMGSRNEDLVVRLKELGIDDPEKVPPQPK